MTLQVRWCPQCGTRRTGYFRFCGRCGLDFDELTLRPHDEQPTAEARPEPTTPIWPTPVQWPPPDAKPVTEVVTPAADSAPAAVAVATPPRAEAATPPRAEPAVAAPSAEAATPAPRAAGGVDWPTATRTSTEYVQQPAQRPLLARQLAVPAPTAADAVAVPAPVRRPAITFTRIAIVALAALLLVNAVSRAISQSASSSRSAAPTTDAGSPLVVEPTPAPPSSAAITPGPSFAPLGERNVAVVTKIVDGDTIRVDIDGTEYLVGYVGIDAPDPKSSDPAVKQVADEATAKNAELVEGKEVFLERDVTDRDGVTRLLRNVWFIDIGGSYVLVNLELVRLGYATATVRSPDQRYMAYLATAETAAKTDQAGIWRLGSTSSQSP